MVVTIDADPWIVLVLAALVFLTSILQCVIAYLKTKE